MVKEPFCKQATIHPSIGRCSIYSSRHLSSAKFFIKRFSVENDKWRYCIAGCICTPKYSNLAFRIPSYRARNETGVVASTSTVKRRLITAGLNGRIARRKPLLLPRHKITHLEWAKAHAQWTDDMWKRVVWSDESKFNIFKSDGRTYIRRRKSEEFNEDCVVGTVKHGGGSVMVWGCICGDQTGMLLRVDTTMNAHRYLQVLEDGMIPSAWAARGLDFIFMHDNAPCHRANIVSEWLSEQDIEVTAWPPQSPDLNPIKNLWDYIERQVDKLPSTTKEDLWKNLKSVWDVIPSAVIENLVCSMPRRVTEVIKAKGCHTKY